MKYISEISAYHLYLHNSLLYSSGYNQSWLPELHYFKVAFCWDRAYGKQHISSTRTTIKLRILGSEIGARPGVRLRELLLGKFRARVCEISDIYGESLSCSGELTLINVSVLLDLKRPASRSTPMRPGLSRSIKLFRYSDPEITCRVYMSVKICARVQVRVYSSQALSVFVRFPNWSILAKKTRTQ